MKDTPNEMTKTKIGGQKGEYSQLKAIKIMAKKMQI